MRYSMGMNETAIREMEMAGNTRIEPQDVWERELLAAYQAQEDRWADAAKAGDMDAFNEHYRYYQTIYETAKKCGVALGTLAWNSR